jgi:hypothetical protein
VSESDVDQAIQAARSALGLDDDVAATLWPVEHLDAHDRGYVLVVFGPAEASVGVAAVTTLTGNLGEWARLPGVGPHLTIDAAAARRVAGVGDEASAGLAWQPGPISRSPLYPFWIVQTGGSTRYVDLGGRVWSNFEARELRGGS